MASDDENLLGAPRARQAQEAWRWQSLTSMISPLTVTSESMNCCALSGEQYLRMESRVTNDHFVSPEMSVAIE